MNYLIFQNASRLKDVTNFGFLTFRDLLHGVNPTKLIFKFSLLSLSVYNILKQLYLLLNGLA